MAKLLKMKRREQCITKNAEKAINPFIQHYIWENIVSKMRINGEQIIELELSNCPVCEKQRIHIVDTLGKNVDSDHCFYFDEVCNKTVYVIYDTEADTEYMMLASEATVVRK